MELPSCIPTEIVGIGAVTLLTAITTLWRKLADREKALDKERDERAEALKEAAEHERERGDRIEQILLRERDRDA